MINHDCCEVLATLVNVKSVRDAGSGSVVLNDPSVLDADVAFDDPSGRVDDFSPDVGDAAGVARSR